MKKLVVITGAKVQVLVKLSHVVLVKKATLSFLWLVE